MRDTLNEISSGYFMDLTRVHATICLLAILLFPSPSIAATPPLCGIKKSKAIIIIENNTTVSLKAVRVYERDPARPAIEENIVRQNLGYVNPIATQSARLVLKTGSNAMVFTPICSNKPMLHANGKPVTKKIKYIEKRGRVPNCTKRYKFVLLDSSFNVYPLSCGLSYGNFGGTWTCPGRGTMTVNQNGAGITGGNFGGTVGQDWAAPNNGIIAAGGTVDGKTMTAKLLHNSGNYSIINVTLSENTLSFTGGWKWYSPGGALLASGAWSCNR